MTTVLIVDDHPSFRASARALLETEGFDVVGEAQDGESLKDRVADVDEFVAAAPCRRRRLCPRSHGGLPARGPAAGGRPSRSPDSTGGKCSS